MGWWSDFRDNVLKPVAGVVLLGNTLGGGGGGNFFSKLFGGGAAASNPATAAGLSTTAGAVPSMIPGAAGANFLTNMGMNAAAAAGTTGAAAGGILGKGLGNILGGNSALTTAMLMGARGKSGVPKIEMPQLDANAQALKNKLTDTLSSTGSQYQNAYSQFDPNTLKLYADELKRRQEQAQSTGFKPINPQLM